MIKFIAWCVEFSVGAILLFLGIVLFFNVLVGPLL